MASNVGKKLELSSVNVVIFILIRFFFFDRFRKYSFFFFSFFIKGSYFLTFSCSLYFTYSSVLKYNHGNIRKNNY